jgi:hypothetical protein
VYRDEIKKQAQEIGQKKILFSGRSLVNSRRTDKLAWSYADLETLFHTSGTL